MKTYQEVTQWQGKEMHDLGRILSAFAIALLYLAADEVYLFR